MAVAVKFNPLSGKFDFVQSIGSLDDRFVNKTGDTMTGLLILSGAPVVDLGAATKKYVDDAVATVDTLAEVLAIGNTTGGTDIAVSAADDITFTDTSKIIMGTGADASIYYDGTNLVVNPQVVGSGTFNISAGGIQLASSTLVTGILDEDNMASDSAVSLATQQSIKAYTDAHSLDSAYNAGTTITADAGAVQISTPNTSNNSALIINQLDTTNNPSAILIANSGSGNDIFATNWNIDKTGLITAVSINLGVSTTISSFIDDDTMGTASATAGATSESIKAYVDAQVATVDTWAEILALGNTSGATDAIITAGQKITTDTITETTAASGVTIETILLKDGDIVIADSDTISFGTGSDATLQYDGTNMLYNSLVVGSGEHQFTGDIALQTGYSLVTDDAVDAIKSGDYALQFQSNATGVGTAPSQVGANIVSYWTFDDNSIFPEDTTDANLIAWWKMETGSGTTLTDEQGNVDGVISSPDWVGSGAFTGSTNSLSFPNAAGNIINLSSGSNFDFLFTTQVFTISVWLKIDTLDTNNANVIFGNTGSVLNGCLMFWEDRASQSATRELRMIVGADGGGSFSVDCRSVDSAITDTNWHQVTFTTDTVTSIWYVDGVAIGNKSSSVGGTLGTGSKTAEYAIGALTGDSLRWGGDIDNMAIYDDVRTAEEILRDYDKTRTTIAADYVGPNDGTLTGNTAFATPGTFGYTGDEYLTFDGTGDYLNVPDDATLDFERTDTFSIVAWVKTTSNGETILAKRDNSGGQTRGYELWNNGSGQLSFLLVNDNSPANYLYVDGTDNTINDGAWHMVVVTYDGSSTAAGTLLYVDGIAQTKTVNQDNLSATTLNNVAFRVGSREAGDIDFTGDIDNVIVYDDVRTPAEILADYNNGQPASTMHIFDTGSTVGSSGISASFRNNTVEKAFIDINGEGNFAGIDVNGSAIILDADGDTSITADTDDQIDIEIAGADDFQFTANTFTALSGSSILTNTISETTAASGVTIDSVLIKDGGLTIVGGSGILKVDEITETTATAGVTIQKKLKIGSGETGVDYTLTFDGETNDGLITWMEDEKQLVLDSTFVTQEGRIKNTTRVTTTYTILVTDDVVFANTDSAGYTVTLPTGAEGQTVKVINSGSTSNTLTVAPNGAEHLMGANSSFALYDAETLILTYSATDGWY